MEGEDQIRHSPVPRLSFHQLLWQLFFQAQKNTASSTTGLRQLLKVKLLWYRQSALIWNVLTLPWHLERFVTLSGVDQPIMSQAEWALLAMLGKHQEVFDFVQEVLLTDGFSLTSIYNSDVRHPVDGYFCRCTYTSLMGTFCTFTSNHPFQGWYLLPNHGSIPGTT